MYSPGSSLLQNHVPGKLFAAGLLPYSVIISQSHGIQEQQQQQCALPASEVVSSEALTQMLAA